MTQIRKYIKIDQKKWPSAFNWAYVMVCIGSVPARDNPADLDHEDITPRLKRKLGEFTVRALDDLYEKLLDLDSGNDAWVEYLEENLNGALTDLMMKVAVDLDATEMETIDFKN